MAFQAQTQAASAAPAAQAPATQGTAPTAQPGAISAAFAAATQNMMGQAQQPQQPQAGVIGFPDAWSFLDGNMPGAITGISGNEQVVALKEKIEECYKHSPHAKHLKVIVLDNENNKGLYFSTLLVCYNLAKGAGVAYIPLIMESSNVDVPSYIDNSTGIAVEIFRASSDAYDQDLVAYSTSRVSKDYPGEAVRVCEGIVVPRNFDTNDRAKVSSLAMLAGCAVGLRLQLSMPNFKDLDLTKIKKNDSNKEINISFGRQQLQNALGDPVRSDFLVNFCAKAIGGNNQNRSLNGSPKIATISNVSGFFDLVYSPAVPPEMAMYQYMTGQFNPNLFKKWVPRAIITDVSSSFSNTPANIMLAILTVATIRDNMNWVHAFRSGTRGHGVDLHDIGALNFEANLPNVEGFDPQSKFGRRKNTKGNFSSQELYQFITTVMQTQPILSIDVPETGPQSWYLGIIAAAAKGSATAVQALLNTMDKLTGGNFSNAWALQPDKTIFVDVNNRVHLGYYTSEDGTLHDIRDWDYLAVANVLGDNSPDLIAEWSDTFYNSGLSSEVRISRRRKMIADLTQGTAVFTGHAQRITFSASFLQAALNAINAAGLSVNTRCGNLDVGQGRGVANFAQQAMMPVAAMTFNPYTSSNAGTAGYGGYWGTY